MGQDLFFRFPIEVMVAFVVLLSILFSVARVLITLSRPAPGRVPAPYGDAPYKLEAPGLLRPGRLDVVPQAGREPANR